jgi:GTP1/Obg family GTP-binding protein
MAHSHTFLIDTITDERNNIEKLTLAVLSHLPTAVLYVHDLSGDCGTSPDDQANNKTLFNIYLFCLKACPFQ